jgi:Mg-chelatase subunit ChlI
MDVVANDPFNSHIRSWIEWRSSKKFGETLGQQLKIYYDWPSFRATEDRVCGTIDIEKSSTEGVKLLNPVY